MTVATLCFDRAGTRLLVVQPDAITVVDAAVRRTTRLSAFTDARAAAGFDDQRWIAPDMESTARGLNASVRRIHFVRWVSAGDQKPKDDPAEQAH